MDSGSDSSSSRSLDNNLDLALYQATQTNGIYSTGSVLQQSISTQDNVERLWLPSLAPGDYALKIWAADHSLNLDYAVAWMTIPEPVTFIILLAGFGVIRSRRCQIMK
jgi:hypothetical protein